MMATTKSRASRSVENAGTLCSPALREDGNTDPSADQPRHRAARLRIAPHAASACHRGSAWDRCSTWRGLGDARHRASIEDSRTRVVDRTRCRVARAWKYGPKRTVPPATVAEVFGALHSATAVSSAFLDEDTVQTYKKVSGPKRAAAVALPTETTVDGDPAVVYCLTSSARGTPFSVVTAIVKPDYKVELRVQPVLED